MGTNYLAPTWRQPENLNKDRLSNYSIDFDGVSGVNINAGTISSLNNTSAFTISFWSNFDTPQANDGVIFTNRVDNNNRITIYRYNTLIYFHINSSGSNQGNVTAPLTGSWAHIAMVYDGSGSANADRLKVYFDGVEQTLSYGGTIPATTGTYSTSYLGARGDGTNEYHGKLDEVSIFDYALTDGTAGTVDQISYLYNLNNPMAISGVKPIAYWPLGDNSNPTSLAGYPNISVGASSAFEIPGGNTYPNTITFGTKNSEKLKITDKITISIWIKTTDNNYSGLPLEPFLTRNQYSEGWLIGKRWETSTSDGFLRMWFYNADGTGNVLDAAGNWDDIANGAWHHIAYTYDGTSNAGGLKVYVDGQPSNSMATASTGIKDSTGSVWDTLILGMRQYTYETIDGEYSNLSIFNSDLPATGTQSIESLYANGVPPEIGNYSNLVGWWKLDQSANWEADSAGNWQIPDALSAYPQSFSFNGVDDQINLGFESDLSLGGASKYSISLWFKKDSDGTNCFWGYNYGDPNGSGLYIWQTSGAFRVAVGNNSLTTGFGYYNIASANVPIGEWINVVVVFDGTLVSGNDRIKVYQNGEIATGTYVNGSNFPATLPNGNGANNRNVYLGQLQLANGSFSYSFDGKMSNVMQWTTDLSLTDANTIYNNGVPLPTASVKSTDLKAWYKLDNTAIWYPTQQYWGIPNAASNSNILNFSN